MKKILYLFPVLLFAQRISAQVPEDALRMTFNPQWGTARNQAIGGAAGSLGGDISSLFVNPAGLGFYKTGEFVFTPGFSFLNEKSNYLGSRSTAESMSKFNIGTTGFVWSQPNYRNPMWKNTTGSIAINRVADFNGRIYYKGQNDFSSYSEQYAEEFARSGVSFSDPMYSAPLNFATKLAAYTYLIDTLTTSQGVEVAGMPERDAILNNTNAKLLQEKDVITKGGITEVAFGYAANYNDKFYIGGSIGLPIVNFKRTATFTESDLSGDHDNNFNYSTYREDYKASGVGLNLKLGVIFKPAENFRTGISINTPSIYALSEKTTGRMENDLENYLTTGPIVFANADSIYTQNGADIPVYKYDFFTPWKFLVSGSYIFGQVEDVKQQKGFITADVEYVTYGSSRFHSANGEDDESYYEGVNDVVKAAYKGALNMRIGGELKFNTIMGRLGFAYYGNPYSDPALKASKMNVSGGLGYRDHGIFVDLTYVHNLNKDTDFPYRLADKANTFADIRNSNSRVLLTFGVKF